MNQDELDRKIETLTDVFELLPEDLAHVAGGPEVGNEPPPR